MKPIIGKVKYFLVPYFITFIICTILIVLYSKPSIHIWINQYYSPWADVFFMYYTNIGDGLFVIIIALIFMLWKFGASLVIIASYLLSSVVVQLIKHVIYPSALRPKGFFENSTSLHFVEGVKLYLSHSFPSGHTTSAFAMFLALSFFTTNKWVQLCCFLLAVMVGYSRMYLSQHFLVDVLAGSFIGVIMSMGVLYWYTRNTKNWMHRGLLVR